MISKGIFMFSLSRFLLDFTTLMPVKILSYKCWSLSKWRSILFSPVPSASFSTFVAMFFHNILAVALRPSSGECSNSTFVSICNTLASDLELVSRSQVQFGITSFFLLRWDSPLLFEFWYLIKMGLFSLFFNFCLFCWNYFVF